MSVLVPSFSVAAKLERDHAIITPPWIMNPWALVSWWDMERFAAEKFLNIGSQLAGMSGVLNRLNPSELLDLRGRLETAAKLKTMAATCRAISLRVTAGHTEQVVKNLETPDARFSAMQVSQMLISLGMNLSSEMGTHLF